MNKQNKTKQNINFLTLFLFFIDSLLSLHGGSSHEDEGLYGKAEDEDLERKFMTPKQGRTPSVTDTKKGNNMMETVELDSTQQHNQ